MARQRYRSDMQRALPTPLRAAAPPSTSSSQPAQIARAVAGDQAALSALLEDHYDLVRYMLFRLCGPGPDFDDLQQTVLVEVLQSLPRFRNDCSLATFIAH